MRNLLFAALLLAAAPAYAQEPAENVNSRYTVEKVEVTPPRLAKLSRQLREDLRKLEGEKLNQTQLDSLGRRIKKETGATSITQKVEKGSEPEKVKVVYELKRDRYDIDIGQSRIAWNSRLGWSGTLLTDVNFAGNRIAAGYTNTGDEQVERYSGWLFRFERKRLVGEKVGLRFSFDGLHQQWDKSLFEAAGPAPTIIYRWRHNIQPELDFHLAPGLTLSFGASLQEMQRQYPVATNERANAGLAGLRYERHWRGDGAKQAVILDYRFRYSGESLGSDFLYRRHLFNGEYSARQGHNAFIGRFRGGALSGEAPLFERFVLGNHETLRGWTKYELTPLGASRIAAGTVEYRHDIFQVFWDSGAAWEKGQKAEVHHSLGVGIAPWREKFHFSVGFPLREHGIRPVYMLGVTF